MYITKFQVNIWNGVLNVTEEPVYFYTFFGAIWYILKYYYKHKKYVNNMNNFHIKEVKINLKKDSKQ